MLSVKHTLSTGLFLALTLCVNQLSFAQTDTYWTGAAGNNLFSDAGNWSNGVPNTMVDGHIDGGAISASQVNIDSNTIVNELVISENDFLNLMPGQTLNYQGLHFDSFGLFKINQSTFSTQGSASSLQFNGTGQVEMVDGIIVGDFYSNLVNLNNFSGSGHISEFRHVGANRFDVEGGDLTIDAFDVAPQTSLDFADTSVSIDDLNISAGTVLTVERRSSAATGKIATFAPFKLKVAGQGKVRLTGDVALWSQEISGAGLLNGAGEIEFSGSNNRLAGHSTQIDDATVRVTNGSDLSLVLGSQIQNNSTIILDSTGNQTVLDSHGAFLTGSGTVELRDNAVITSTQQGPSSFANEFTSSNQIIGNGKLDFYEFTNLGTIAATGGGAITIDSQVTHNAGRLEAAANSTLILQGTKHNSNGTTTANEIQNHGGVIEALDNAVVRLHYTEVIGGTLTTSGTGRIELRDGANLKDVLIEGLAELAQNNGANSIFLKGQIELGTNGVLGASGIGNRIFTDSESILAGTGEIQIGPGSIIRSSTRRGKLTNLTSIRFVGGDNIMVSEDLTNENLVSVENGSTNTIYDSLIDNQGTFRITGSTMRLQDSSLINYSAGTLSGGRIEAINGGIFQNQNFDISTNLSDIVLSGAGSALVNEQPGGVEVNALQNLSVNAGLLTIAEGAVLETNFDLENSGTIEVTGNASFLRVGGGGGEFRQTNGLTRINSLLSANNVILDGGTLQGDGIVEANLFQNSGLLAAGNSTGDLDIVGDYIQGTGGVLELEIAGELDHDRYFVAGLADLDGILEVNWLGGYTPTVGQEFLFLSASNATADFVAIQSNRNYQYSVFDLGEGQIGLRVTAVPEPMTGWLVAGCGVLVAARRRRELQSRPCST